MPMDKLNSMNIIEIIFKKIKTLAVVAFVAAVIAFGFSFLLKEKYKSTAVVYP
ncbi:MAG: Wzz/FepE/Etk N-terminal domain-containing protein, partial [Bacteroidia bacterium]